MQMLKPVVLTELSLRDRHTFTSPTQPKHSNQENRSVATKTYTPYHHKYTHGIGLSLKGSQNRQAQKPANSSNFSQQCFDGYLQKVIKTNLEKISQIRNEHEKQKEIMIKEILTLKTENSILKAKLQEPFSQGNINQTDKSKQLSHSLQKRLLNKFLSEKLLSPNPEKHQQNECAIKEMTQKIEKYSRETEEYKKRNSILSLQKRNLNLTIQKLQKQSQIRVTQLDRLHRIQQKLKIQLNDIKSILSATRMQYQTEKNQLIKQIEKMKYQKETRKQKQKEKKKLTNITILSQDNATKNLSDSRNIPLVDKRMVKHFQNQIKDRQAQICQKNILIDELNDKIMANGLYWLNTRYRYLSKA